ncbi:MAG: glycosyltransferase family 2 protein [Paracoccaceae bacterium]
MRITIVTTMRNEGPHLLEWLAHHKAAGVTDFLIYSNECADGTDTLLDVLDQAGLVTHIRQKTGSKPPQWQALRAAWEHPVVTGSDWLACIDCDEFINLNNSFSGIPHLIEQSGADAIALQWRLFGHNGHADITDTPTTERFTAAAPPNLIYPALGNYFKTLFRRQGPFRQFGVHRPRQKAPPRHAAPVWRDGAGRTMPQGFAQTDTRILIWPPRSVAGEVRLNHYSLRSAADFMIKRDRGLPNHRKKPIDLSYWVERNFNTCEDRSIAAMRPATEACLTDLRAISGVSELQDAAVDWHRRRFEELLSDPEELKLYGRILLASGSTPPEDALARELIERYRANHA